MKEDRTQDEKKVAGLQKDSEVVLTDDKTAAEKIWNEIKEMKIDMFSLPNQKIEQHVKMVQVEPSSLYVELYSSATLPALEEALKNGYSVEVNGRFIKILKKDL